MRFDLVFRAHHSDLARRSLRDKPSEFSDLSRQLLGLEERRERGAETSAGAAMQILLTDRCRSCFSPPLNFAVRRPSPRAGEEKVTFVLYAPSPRNRAAPVLCIRPSRQISHL